MTKKSKVILGFAVAVVALGAFAWTTYADCYRGSILTKIFGSKVAFASKLPCVTLGSVPKIPDEKKTMVLTDNNCFWEDEGAVSLERGQIIRIKNACGSNQWVAVTDTVQANWGFSIGASKHRDFECKYTTTWTFFLVGSSFEVECS